VVVASRSGGPVAGGWPVREWGWEPAQRGRSSRTAEQRVAVARGGRGNGGGGAGRHAEVVGLGMAVSTG
jgi:hypothetical protein